ncbi:MAG: alpha/beta fold hydrolase [Betaproteobacteria bacterium]|nr:alpha/beta fold hydrolase [Betaproteobacteria bacterium]
MLPQIRTGLLAMVLVLGPGLVARADEPKIFTLASFTFENGKTLNNMRVAYDTHGELNAARDNALLVTHGASQGRNGYKIFIGPGKAFDTNRYFVITVDAIGGGGSSKPADGLGAEFPAYGIRDMVRAQYDLVTKGLGLKSLVAVGGPSMGSFQALEWGIHFRDFMKGLLLIVPSARSDRHVHAIFDAVISTIKLDGKWNSGNYTENPVDGIVTAGMIYFPWLYSDEHLNTLVSDEDYQKAQRAFGAGWAKVWDARGLIYRYQATAKHDVSQPFGGDMADSLGRIKAKTLIMPGMTDRTLPSYMGREIYRGVKNSVYVEIPSYLGHIACCPSSEDTAEYVFISAQIKRFLADLAR